MFTNAHATAAAITSRCLTIPCPRHDDRVARVIAAAAVARSTTTKSPGSTPRWPFRKLDDADR